MRREILPKVKVSRNRAELSRRENENVRTTLEQGAPRGGDGYVSAPGGGGVLPYMGYIGMCRCEGYGFQAVYSRIGYINQSVWL